MRRAWSAERVALVVCAAAVAAAAGCGRRGELVAKLFEAQGVVETSTGEGWSAAAAGHDLAVGDSLRTGARSTARLRLVNGGVIRLAENGRLRLTRGAPPPGRPAQAPALALELGSAEIEQAAQEMEIATPLGLTRIPRDAHVRLRTEGGSTSLEVIVGRAVLLGPDGAMAVEAGQGLRIRIGSAAIERFHVAFGAAEVEPAARAEAPAAPAAPVAVEPELPPAPAPAPAAPVEKPVPGRTATRADLTVAAGESATLHDGRSSLAVRLRFDHLCPDEALVAMGAGRRARELAGARFVVLRLRAGTQRYQVRCAGDDARTSKPRATGVLALRRDSGNAPLSRRAPANVIEADGRRYTVLYQTRLPALTLAWPGAPADARGLSLHLASPAGEEIMAATSARRQLSSGTLREGTYTWWYATAEGRTSPRTTVTIRFDNAAPTAQFFRASPDAARAVPPPAIPIEGVTLEGAKVSAAGQPVAIDGDGRFRAAVAPLEGDDAVAVRLEHPRTGIHYYVRRAGRAHDPGAVAQ